MENAQLILRELENRGFAAYIVGGAVRDRLRGVVSQDIDILTQASPEQVRTVAESCGWRTKNIGATFGITVVVVGRKAYEVATARAETYGEDSHRPEQVHYVSDIVEDLARRDFTINAMAMDSGGKIIDPFGGRQDLERGVIRAVGDPYRRFAEDGLRSYRALRLVAQLGFSVDDATRAALQANLDRVMGLSVERVRDELNKLLMGPFATKGLRMLVETGLAKTSCCGREKGRAVSVEVLPELVHLVGLEQSPRYHSLDAWEHTLAVLTAVPADLSIRWAALLHDVAKGMPGIRGINRRGELSDHGHDRLGAEMAEAILARLRQPDATARGAVWLVANHMVLPPARRPNVVRWLRKKAVDFKSKSELSRAVRQLLVLCRADVRGGMVNPDFSALDRTGELEEEILAAVPFYPAELAITGKEIALAIGEGPQVGRFLTSLLERIQTGQLQNDPAELHAALRKKKERLQRETLL